MKREKTSTRPNARWPGFARPSMTPAVVAIAITALCFSACATQRKMTTLAAREQAAESIMTDVARYELDSVSGVSVIKTEAVKVPTSKVMLTIPMDSLQRLPVGASYTDRSGQASVKVSRRPATAAEPEYIYIDATCDSLLLQCERYERTIRTLRKNYGEQHSGLKIRVASQAQETREMEEKPTTRIRTAFKWLLCGILLGVIISRYKRIISIIKKQ